MEKKTITKVVNKLNAAFQQRFPDIENVKFKEEDKYCLLSFNIEKVAEVSCKFNNKGDTVIMRCDTHPKGLDDDKLNELGAELAEKMDPKVRCTANDGTLIFMEGSQLDLGSDDDEPISNDFAEREVFNFVMAFIQPLVSFKGRLRGKTRKNNEENNEESSEIVIDPFGFDDIIVDETLIPTGDSEGENESDSKSESDSGPFDGEHDNDNALPTEGDRGVSDCSEANNSDVDEEPHSDNTEINKERVSDDMAENNLNITDDTIKNLQKRITDLQQFLNTAAYEQQKPPSIKPQPAILTERPQTAQESMRFTQPRRETVSPKATVYRGNEERFENFDDITDLIQNAQNETRKAFETFVSVVDNTSDLGNTLRNKRRELIEMQNELDSARFVLSNDRDSFEKEKAEFETYTKQVKAVSEERDRLKSENNALISRLTETSAALTAQTQKAREAENKVKEYETTGVSGGVSQEYAQSMKRQMENQDLFISQQKLKLEQSVSIINELQKALEQTQSNPKASAQESEAARKKAEKQELAWKNKEKEWLRREKAEKAESDELRKQIDNLKLENEELSSAKGSVSALEGKINELQAMCDDERKRREKAEQDLKEKEESESLDVLGEKIKASMNTIGVPVTRVAGESKMMLGGRKGENEIFIDVEKRILYVRKTMKRAKKVQGDLTRLNSMSIQESYSIEGNVISCKTFCCDVDQIKGKVQEITSRFDQMI